MLKDIVFWIVATIGVLGYPGIFILMALESSFFPFPSEVVIIPAGYHAYNGDMNMILVVLFGVAGSIAGAFFNYYIAARLGRPFIIRFGKYFLLSEKKLDKAERFFKNHGSITTFIGRLIPGVRQVISFPAGLARMNLVKFTAYTAAGAGIWVVILAVFGYYAGKYQSGVMDLWNKHGTLVTVALIVFVVLVLAIYILLKVLAAKKEKQAAQNLEKEIS